MFPRKRNDRAQRDGGAIVAGVFVLAAVLLPVPIALGMPVPGQQNRNLADEAWQDYVELVKPILKTHCYACHGGLKQEAGLRLDTADLVRKGGDGGAIIDIEFPRDSLMLERVSSEDEYERMPPEGRALSNNEIAILTAWLAQGAPGPPDEVPERDADEHWAFQPIQRPALPPLTHVDSSNPIDVFIHARLQEVDIEPMTRASREVLLRRVYIDLIGIPPTRDQLLAFLDDRSPDAYERVVDRLLADPRYGERWGRHWMDVWRYSDWYGRRGVPDVWNSAPQIWRWRDWIVQSLNDDKGYDQMVREMLAGDEIRPGNHQVTVATGYLVRNWYALNPNDWMRNTVEHTGKAFLGLTFNCAHCHDHKYDPISQLDYFRMRAFFEPMYVRQDRVAGEADPGPFQDYEYSTLRKIQRLGSVQVFDQSQDAPTWFYLGGDERNRVTERGSIPPGVPDFLSDSEFHIETVDLPLEASFPELRPELSRQLMADAQAVVDAANAQLESYPPIDDSTQHARSAQVEDARERYRQSLIDANLQLPDGAIAGEQSLMVDAQIGRRIVQHALLHLDQFPDQSVVQFKVRILNDDHFNFQLAKDAYQGLTAAYVGFKQGRIISYAEDTTTEFDVGSYAIDPQRVFLVRLQLDAIEDVGILSVQDMSTNDWIVQDQRVAMNGWKPVVDRAMAISFDTRAGTRVLVDDVLIDEIDLASSNEEHPAQSTLVRFDFEPPQYSAGFDIVDGMGWFGSTFNEAPARSSVVARVGDAQVDEALSMLVDARMAQQEHVLHIAAIESQRLASQSRLDALQSKMTTAQLVLESPDSDETREALIATNRLERQADLKACEARVVNLQWQLSQLATSDSDSEHARQEVAASFEAAVLDLHVCRLGMDQAFDPADSWATGSTYPRTSTGRRTALAEWITRDSHPLTARVAVNHIWLRHFQSALVRTVEDFGRNGADPTHPKLIDWLASELIESNWNMKHVHRLIVTSESYCRDSRSHDRDQSFNDSEVVSANAPSVTDVDPDNALLWRMNPRRLESEAVRDSILFCADRLDFEFGGQERENSDSMATFRRSLYYSIYPEDGGLSPFGRLFDGPDPLGCYRRTKSIVPQQALALTNSDFVHDASVEIVRRYMESDADQTDDEYFVTCMFETVLSRRPRASELTLCLEYLAHSSPDDDVQSDATTVDESTRASLVRALFNHHEFITVR